MKESYTAPQLHICCFAPCERLASLVIEESLYCSNAVDLAAASGTEQKPGDIFFPIPTP